MTLYGITLAVLWSNYTPRLGNMADHMATVGWVRMQYRSNELQIYMLAPSKSPSPVLGILAKLTGAIGV